MRQLQQQVRNFFEQSLENLTNIFSKQPKPQPPLKPLKQVSFEHFNDISVSQKMILAAKTTTTTTTTTPTSKFRKIFRNGIITIFVGCWAGREGGGGILIWRAVFTLNVLIKLN